MLGFKELKAKGAFPSDIVQIKIKNNIISPDAYIAELEKTGKCTKYVTIDNPVWLAKSDKRGFVYAGNAEGNMSKFVINKRGYSTVEPTTNRDGKVVLTSTYYKQLRVKNNKNKINESEDNKMAQEFNVKDLEEQLGNSIPDLGAGLDTTATTDKMDAFNQTATEEKKDMTPEELKKEQLRKEKAAKKSAINALITENVKGVETADASELIMFNRDHGRYICSVVRNEEINKFSTRKVYMKDEDGKKMLKPNVSDDVKARVKAGNSVDNANFMTEVRLKVGQSAPGPFMGSVISIPVGGLVPLSDLRGTNPVKPNTAEKSLKYVLADKDEVMNYIAAYFGMQIQEDEATFGQSAGTIKLELDYKTKTDKETQDEVTVLRQKLKSETGRKTIIIPNTYFPLSVYETIDVSGPLTAEQCEVVNNSAFMHLYKAPTTKSADKLPKIDQLAGEDKAKISKDEKGVITSKFFTPEVDGRATLAIDKWYAKGELVEDIQMPIKVDINANNPDKNPVWRFKSHNVLGKDVDLSKTSLELPKYKVVRDACHGALTLESLTATLKSSKGSGKGKGNVIATADARALMMKNLESNLTGLEVEGQKSKLDVAEFASRIAELRR